MTLDLWILLAALIITNAFWAYQCHVLMNKLMAGDYYSYKFTKTGPPKVQATIRDEDIGSREEENDILAELNGRLPK